LDQPGPCPLDGKRLVSSNQNLATLRSLQDWYLRYALQSVPGVAEVAPLGGFVRQYQVNIDPNKLLGYKIPINMVVDAIGKSNNDVGARLVEMAGREYMVRGRGYLKGIADIEQIVLRTNGGTPVSLRALSLLRLVLYLYPRTGHPDRPTPDGWDQIPGARGCTPQSCAFRDHAGELEGVGARVAGLSAQPLEEQLEFAKRNDIPYPVIADPELKLGAAIGLPTFEFDGAILYRRMTLVVEGCAISKVFYPVFPPDTNATEVVAWLKDHG